MSLGQVLRAVAVLIALVAAGTVSAHEVRPALLQITQYPGHRYDVLWKQPVNGEVALHLVPRLSGGALDVPPTLVSATPTFAISSWRNLSDEQASLDGQTLTIEGLQRSITDVLVSVTLVDGRTVQHFLKPSLTSVTLDVSGHVAPPAGAYLALGIEHILTGTDHLLFVLGLVLLVRQLRPLLKTITAFTAAHSVTLAATALGWIHVDASVIEALVALSIVILAVELVRHANGQGGLTSRYPWLIAFGFGLLHGCAFAGALAEVGLPAQDIPLALLLFNVGVEIGQVLFILAALALIWCVLRLVRARPRVWPQWASLVVPYAIGTFACYWFLERFLLALVTPSTQALTT